MQLADGDQLESKFRQMEGGDVDEELNKMKRSLPAASSSSSSSSSNGNSNAGRPVRCVNLSMSQPDHDCW